MDETDAPAAAEAAQFEAAAPPAAVRRDRRSLPLGLRRYRPGIFDRYHGPGSRIVTASQVPALFGQSRFAGRYALAAHIMGKVPLRQPTEALVERGQMLEPVVAALIARETGWEVQPVRAWAAHHKIDRFIASPDFIAYRKDRDGPGIIEAKVVADLVFEKLYEDAPPLEVELQHQAQYACTGATWGAIAPLVLGTFRFDQIVYHREPEPDTIRILEDGVAAFLAMVDLGRMPDPDEHNTSIDALAAIYPEVEPGKVARLVGEDADEAVARFDAWQQARLDALAAEKTEEAAKNWFFTRAPDAGQIRVGNDRVIDVSIHHRKESKRIVAAGSYRKWKLARASDAGEAEAA